MSGQAHTTALSGKDGNSKRHCKSLQIRDTSVQVRYSFPRPPHIPQTWPTTNATLLSRLRNANSAMANRALKTLTVSSVCFLAKFSNGNTSQAQTAPGRVECQRKARQSPRWHSPCKTRGAVCALRRCRSHLLTPLQEHSLLHTRTACRSTPT